MKGIFSQQWPAGLALAIIFFLLLVSVVTPLMGDLGVHHWNADFTQDTAAQVPASSINTLGKDLVDPDKYMLPFEVASLLLMAAMIGAVLIVNPGKEEENSDS
jgi:NADH:ubiquinone oxidoreductase subunit 6 (subunit J)